MKKFVHKSVIALMLVLSVAGFLYAQTTIIGDWNFRANNIAWIPLTSGGIEHYRIGNPSALYSRSYFRHEAGSLIIGTENTSGTTTPVVIRGDTDIYMGPALGGAIGWRFNANGSLHPSTSDGTEDLGTAALRVRTAYFGNSTLGNLVTSQSSISAGDDPNYLSYQNRITTADAVTATLHAITLSDNNVYLVEARVVARCTGGAGGNVGSGASYVLKQAFKRSGGGAAAIGATVTDTWEDAAIAGWSAVLDTSGNDVRVRVTGGATDNATWHCTIIVQNLSS